MCDDSNNKGQVTNSLGEYTTAHKAQNRGKDVYYSLIFELQEKQKYYLRKIMSLQNSIDSMELIKRNLDA